MKLGSNRYKPPKGYWQEIASLDQKILAGAEAAGQTERFTVSPARRIFDSYEGYMYWLAGDRNNATTHWDYGEMSLGWPGIGYLKTADTHLVVPAGATENVSCGRHFHYDYPTPFGKRPFRLEVHELPDFHAVRGVTYLLRQGRQDSIAQLGNLITPGRQEYELLLTQLRLGSEVASSCLGDRKK